MISRSTARNDFSCADGDVIEWTGRDYTTGMERVKVEGRGG